MRNLRESIKWMEKNDKVRWEATIEDEVSRYQKRLGKYVKPEETSDA